MGQDLDAVAKGDGLAVNAKTVACESLREPTASSGEKWMAK
jgi:hypothetical protein